MNAATSGLERAEPTAARRTASARNPYLGLQAFSEGDASYFFGRDREASELFRLVRRGVLTVLFGRSGLGKTSLLHAGLFPKLRAGGYLPVPIRLDYGADGPALDVQVLRRVREVAALQNLEAPAPRDGETLWSYFHRARLWTARNHLLIPVLVFDQFEEVFTLGKNDPRVAPFAEALADLIENQIPDSVRASVEAGEELDFTYEQQKFKVVLGLREDFLAQLEDLRPMIPSLARARLRLLQLDGEAAWAAVRKPGDELVDDRVAAEIVRFVAGAPGEPATATGIPRVAPAGIPASPPRPPEDTGAALESLVVEPALLSLVCRELNQRRQDRRLERITLDLLADQRQNILADFYQRSLIDVAPAVRVFVEDRLLTTSGFRSTVALEDAQRAPGVAEVDLDLLIERRLLRREERLGIPHLELMHDVLTGIVAESRQRRRAREAARRRLRRVGLGGALLIALATLSGTIALWSLKARDEAWEQQRQLARRIADLHQEQGRQALLAGEWQQALVYLSEAYRHGEPPTSLRVLLARAAAPIDALDTLFEGHGDAVWSAEASPDGRRIVTASRDGTARLWDVESGRELAVLSGHRDAVTAASWSPDGRRVITASWDGTAAVWSAEGRLEARLEGHDDVVFSAAASPDGRRIVTAGRDGTARLWTAEGEAKAVLRGHDGPVVAARFDATGRWLATASWDGTAGLWQVADGQRRIPLGEKGGPALRDVRFAPTSGILATVDLAGRIRVWPIADLKPEADRPSLMAWHIASFQGPQRLISARFSRDGERLLAGVEGGGARLFRIHDQRLLASYGLGSRAASSTAEDRAASPGAAADTGPEGNIVDRLLGGPLSPRGGRPGREIDPFTGVLPRALDPQWSAVAVASSAPASELLVAGSDGAARVWDLERRRFTGVHGPFADEPLLSARWTRSGRWVLAETVGGEVHLAEASGSSHLRWPPGTAASPGGERLLVPRPDGRAAVLDVGRDGFEERALLRPSDGVRRATFSSDARRLLIFSWASTVELWDAEAGRLLGLLADASSFLEPQPFAEVARFVAAGERVLTNSADGARLWSAGDGRRLLHLPNAVWLAVSATGQRAVIDDGGLRVWDLSTGQAGSRLQEGPRRVMRKLHLAGNVVVGLPDTWDGAMAYVWDAASGRFRGGLEAHAHEDRREAPPEDEGADPEGSAAPPWLAALAPDGSLLLLTDDERSYLFDLEQLSLVRELDAQVSAVELPRDGGRRAAAVTMDGQAFELDLTAAAEDVALGAAPAEIFEAQRTAAVPPKVATRWFQAAVASHDESQTLTTREDGSIQIWDTTTGRLLKTLAGHATGVWAATFLPGDRAVLSAGSDGVAARWSLEIASEMRFGTENGAESATRDEPAATPVGVATPPGSLEPGALGRVTAADLDPDWQRLALAGDHGVGLWDAGTGRVVSRLEGSAARARAVVFDPRGEWLAAPDAAQRIGLWQASSGARSDYRQVAAGNAPAPDDAPAAPTPGSGSGSEILDLEFDPERFSLLAARADRTSTVLWLHGWDDPALRNEVTSISKRWAYPLSAVATSPDGQRIVVAGEGFAQVASLEFDGPRPLYSLPVELDAKITAVAFNPHGRTLLTAGAGSPPTLWNADDGTLFARLEGHRATVRALEAGEDGDLILTVSGDGSARIWNAHTGRQLVAFELLRDDVVHAELRRDGESLATVHQDGTVLRWPLPRERRDPDEIDALVKCHVPWRLEDGRLLPSEPNPGACRRAFFIAAEPPPLDVPTGMELEP